LKTFNSQSSVATQLQFGGIFNHQFVENFLKSAPVKEF